MLLPLIPFLLASVPQGDGVTLLANREDYGTYNDVWGYTAPDGREYAILGTESGTAFYNVVAPTAPYLTAFIPGPVSGWRDMVTYGAFCYIVTEGGPGIQVVSLANPEAPFLAATAATGSVAHAHTIACDQGTGRLYANGTPSGMRVLDAAANPTNPPLVGTYTAEYVHDSFVQNGRAHLAEINIGRYRIVSVASLPSFPVISVTLTPGTFTHNTWANENDTLCATTDESAGGDVTLYDITNPAAPVKQARISPFGATAHNVYLHDGIAYVSTYTAGFTYWDIANPAAPIYLGRYDTSPNEGSAWSGNWSVYPFTASGLVYASDINYGLFILRPDGSVVDIQHAPLADTEDENGPYPLAADLVATNGTNPVVSAQVVWGLEGGADQIAAMNPAGGNAWSANLAGQESPAILRYRIEATCTNGAIQRLPRNGWLRFHVGRRAQIYATDFEGASDAGWSHGSTAVGDDWMRGDPVGNSDDPADAASGMNCWGNDLGGGGLNGKVLASSSSWLESPAVNCSTASGTRLRFARWLAVRQFITDQARVLVNGAVVWENPAAGSIDDAWQVLDLDISAIADGAPDVKVRFEIDASGGITPGGWNVDDVEIYALRPSGTDSITLSGPTTGLPGQSVQFTISGAPPSGSWWLISSGAVAFTTRFGAIFDLADPASLVAAGATDAAGSAIAVVLIPPGTSGQTIHLEVAARAGLGPFAESNFVTLAVQ
jgi:choice-of-anchor B domain-containing protein